MSTSDRPSLSISIEAEIEGLKRKIHLEYWPRLEQFQEPTPEARDQLRLLSRSKVFDPPPPKSPHALRSLLAGYALRLFETESSFFPVSPDSRHWLKIVADLNIAEVMVRVNQIEDAGRFTYKTLGYHGLDHGGMIRAMREGLKERLAQRSSEYEQRLYNETARHLMGVKSQVSGDVKPASARERFVLPLLLNKGWSVFQWAVEAEVSYNTANGYLKGNKTYASTRVKLARALGIEANRLP